MKVILNYDPATGQITDSTGCMIFTWVGLNYEEIPKSGEGSAQVDGEQLIRVMKIAAHIADPDKVAGL